MEPYKIQIIENIVVIAGYFIILYLTKIFLNNSLKQTHLQRLRRKIVIKAVHLLSFLTATVLLSAIWGLKQNEIAVFVGTILIKVYPFEGEVTDLTYFFVHLKTDDGEIITIPNSLLLQKSVSIIGKK